MIVSLFLLSVLGVVWLSFFTDNGSTRYISVQVDGVERERIPLRPGDVGKHYEITSKYGTNVIEVVKGGVRIIEASCPDKLCEHQGVITKAGQMLVCLPNRLIVEIKDENEKGAPDVIVR